MWKLQLLAAETKCHSICNHDFTRPTPETIVAKFKGAVNEEKYLNAKNYAFKKLFKYICTEIIAKTELTTLTQPTRVATESITQTRLEINTSTKKNRRRKIEMQFSSTLEKFQNDKGKVVAVANTVPK